MKQDFLRKYGQNFSFSGNSEKVVEVLSRIKPMTLEDLKNGETKFFASQAEENNSSAGYCIQTADYRAYAHDDRRGRAIRGTHELLPAPLVKIFPELSDARFFVAEIEKSFASYGQPFTPDPSGTKWIVEFLGDNMLKRWRVPPTVDLATSQIIDLLEMVPMLDTDQYGNITVLKYGGVEFGGLAAWLQEAGIKELIRRSLQSFDSLATGWLAYEFRLDRVDQDEFIGWLAAIVRDNCRLKKLRERFFESPAVRFADQQPITGSPIQWSFLPALPSERKEVKVLEGHFILPNGNSIPVQKIHGTGDYFRAEYGFVDLFLRRGDRKSGDRGWMWVSLSDLENDGSPILAAIDPMENYSALGNSHSPLYQRIMKALALAQGGVK